MSYDQEAPSKYSRRLMIRIEQFVLTQYYSVDEASQSTMHTSYDLSLETAMNESNDDVLILICEAALNKKLSLGSSPQDVIECPTA